MILYRYKVVELPNTPNLENELDEYGVKGWELVKVSFYFANGYQLYKLFFKMPYEV